jgi:hypothetical protein
MSVDLRLYEENATLFLGGVFVNWLSLILGRVLGATRMNDNDGIALKCYSFCYTHNGIVFYMGVLLPH